MSICVLIIHAGTVTLLSSLAMIARLAICALTLLSVLNARPVSGVDQRKFRTCGESAFCRRLRVPLPQHEHESQPDSSSEVDIVSDSGASSKHVDVDASKPHPTHVQSAPHYDVVVETIAWDPSTAQLKAKLAHIHHPLQPHLDLTVSVLKHGIVRLLIDESPDTRKHARWHVRDVIQADALNPFVHSAESGKQFLWQQKKLFAHCHWYIKHQATAKLQSDSFVLEFAPFRLVVFSDGKPIQMVNSRNLLRFEQYREPNPRPMVQRLKQKSAETEETLVDPSAEAGEADAPAAEEYESVPADDLPLSDVAFPYDEPGMWSESFGGQTDHKKRGPAALGMDVDFISTQHVFGLPEHASDFALKSTRGRNASDYTEPFRLYNLDVFEYDLDVPMALYGAVPFIVGHAVDRTMGVLWLNAAETFVDIDDSVASGTYTRNKNVHWMSESGVIDMYLLPGSEQSTHTVFTQYAHLTGFPLMPAKFAIAYHQCRWNYKSQTDVAQVDAGFDEHDIPYDVMWLDIEHTDGKKYMTWDMASFPDPTQMQNDLAQLGRKLVTIVDPHIKRDNAYAIHTHAQEQDLYIHNAAGTPYEGWCWPGSVSYLDFMRDTVRSFWHKALSLEHYTHSTHNLHVWNDMNEPSVFNGPEVTMPKDCMHLNDSVEHRDVHNTYGFYVSMSTAQGLVLRDNKRPFVLTRSFFAGYQRYGAVWTGDNAAEWSHLAVAQPMLLSLGVSGIVFCGADVGGFFGNPSAELLTRWYQAGAYQPFFRAHAHIDAHRREPWLEGEPHTSMRRTAIRRRYQLLPYIYSQFFTAHTSGLPVMRPVWMEFPTDTNMFAEQDSFMLGTALLIHPISQPGQTVATIRLPTDAQNTQRWYRYHSHAADATVAASTSSSSSSVASTSAPLKGGETIECDSPIDIGIPVFQRGGSVIAESWRSRRSSAAMARDPLTLMIALDAGGMAVGDVYVDDGESFDYREKRQFTLTRVSIINGLIRNQFTGDRLTDIRIERIVIRASQEQISQFTQQQAHVTQEATQQDKRLTKLLFDKQSHSITVRAPNVRIDKAFAIQLS